MAAREALREGGRDVREGLRMILRHRDLRRFFAAYLFYEDGVITLAQ